MDANKARSRLGCTSATNLGLLSVNEDEDTNYSGSEIKLSAWTFQSNKSLDWPAQEFLRHSCKSDLLFEKHVQELLGQAGPKIC
ncbi:hypothetical protein PGTUg99_035783 [Puccinia graminis f. sp. tritici]|uniref:Uncharacterized protein n=1 Tax=Puccinia graminis f. sp. tritici TaxID=56615 RepID=A0A5B0Q9F6_PUCGR|nr:hypothetical protein PGTUg99_035783 [Puccinia graminis f. sp. tritici]